MKSTINFILSLFIIFQLQAQAPVKLQINHLIGGLPFSTSQRATSWDGSSFSLSRLQYYISNIQITHDGGQITKFPDTYLFVDAVQKSNVFQVGTAKVSSLEGIQFSIGVNPEANHLDPATYPANHPLAHKNPNMHWGWASGYKFIAIEGWSIKSGASFKIEIHALGDNNYFSQKHKTSGQWINQELIIPVNAEYSKLFDNISISSGITMHSDNSEAATLLKNAQSKVFSPALISGNNNQSLICCYDLYTNEQNQQLTFMVNPNLPKSGQWLISDVFGKSILEGETLQDIYLHLIQFTGKPPGIYVFSFRNSEGIQFVKKFSWNL